MLPNSASNQKSGCRKARFAPQGAGGRGSGCKRGRFAPRRVCREVSGCREARFAPRRVREGASGCREARFAPQRVCRGVSGCRKARFAPREWHMETDRWEALPGRDVPPAAGKTIAAAGPGGSVAAKNEDDNNYSITIFVRVPVEAKVPSSEDCDTRLSVVRDATAAPFTSEPAATTHLAVLPNVCARPFA